MLLGNDHLVGHIQKETVGDDAGPIRELGCQFPCVFDGTEIRVQDHVVLVRSKKVTFAGLTPFDARPDRFQVIFDAFNGEMNDFHGQRPVAAEARRQLALIDNEDSAPAGLGQHLLPQ